jgi:hypothetical protein
MFTFVIGCGSGEMCSLIDAQRFDDDRRGRHVDISKRIANGPSKLWLTKARSMSMRFVFLFALGWAMFSAISVLAAETDPRQLVEQVIKTAGGEDKLLTMFRFRERVLITDTPAAPVAKDEKGNRTSVVQVSGDWWIGTAKRDKDKVRVLCWAWSLRILTDPKSKIQTVPDIKVGDKQAFGLRVTESVKEPIDLFFDKETKRLAAIDYTDTRHYFSEWKKTDAGQEYPAHVSGVRFADRKAGTLKDKQWYQTDILELTPLQELPVELKR